MKLQEKRLSLASYKEEVKSTQKSFLIAPNPRCKLLSVAEYRFESIIHSDHWRGYNGLVDLGYKKHYRVHHGSNEFAIGKRHINGIESFWSFAKNRLSKFSGIPKSTFYLHLKESEFRFNYRNENIYLLLLKMFRKRPLN